MNFTNGLIMKYSRETYNTRYIKLLQGRASWFSEMCSEKHGLLSGGGERQLWQSW